MSAKKRKKKKITFKINRKKPRDPFAKEVTKRKSGPMKDKRKKTEIEEDFEIDEEITEDGKDKEYRDNGKYYSRGINGKVVSLWRPHSSRPF